MLPAVPLEESSNTDDPLLSEITDVPAPENQLYHSNTHDASSVTAANQNETIPPLLPRPHHSLTSTQEFPAQHQSVAQINNFHFQRLQSTLLILFWAVLGEAILWWLVTRSTSQRLEIFANSSLENYPLLLGLIVEFDRLLFAQSLSRSVFLTPCLLLLSAYAGLQFRRSGKISSAPLFVAVLLLQLMLWPWMQQSIWPYLGNILLYAIALTIAAVALYASGLNFVRGMACLSGLILWAALGPYTYAAARLPVIVAGGIIFALCDILGVSRFQVQAFRGWDHTANAEHIMQYTYVIGPLDDILPLILAWLWVEVAQRLITTLGNNYPVPLSAWWAGILILSVYCIAVIFLAFRRTGWQHDSHIYQTLEWQRNGTLKFGSRDVDAMRLARGLSRHSLLIWLGSLTAFIVLLVWWIGVARPLEIPFLITSAGLIGVPIGRLIRQMLANYTGAIEIESLLPLLTVDVSEKSLYSRFRKFVSSQGGLLIWTCISLIVIYDMVRTMLMR